MMALLFTTILFSITINRAEIIENENGDQDGTFVTFALPETMSTAEFSSVNDVIVENNKSLIETLITDDYQNNTDIEIHYGLTGVYFEQSRRGSVSPTEFYSSAFVQIDMTLLSAGALKIPNYITSRSVNVKENCEETGCMNS